MRDLHVVALSEDGRHVVLAPQDGDAREHFRVALDERLLRAVRGELAPPVRGEPAPAGGEPAPPVRGEPAPVRGGLVPVGGELAASVRGEPATPAASSSTGISPREIQARLRDGETVEQIASAAGAPVARVERFAWPVLAEIDRVVSGARSRFVQRARLGPSDLPLGEAVEQRLAEAAGVTPGSVQWTARRQGGGAWLVQVSWTARSRRRTAGWLHDPATRDVVAVDGASAALGHVQHDREAVGRDSAAARTSVPPAARDRTAPGRAVAPTSGRGAAAPAVVGRTGVPVTQARGPGRSTAAQPAAGRAAAV
ncbi:MAG: hypothetical protein AVDCRST_MAG07-467, partial [uncultured Frankineae bacterium]